MTAFSRKQGGGGGLCKQGLATKQKKHKRGEAKRANEKKKNLIKKEKKTKTQSMTEHNLNLEGSLFISPEMHPPPSTLPINRQVVSDQKVCDVGMHVSENAGLDGSWRSWG